MYIQIELLFIFVDSETKLLNHNSKLLTPNLKMPVVTRSQAKALREAKDKAKTYKPVKVNISNEMDNVEFERLIMEMNSLNEKFPNNRGVRQTSMLCDFINKTTPLLEPAIEYISKNLTENNLRLITLLHNTVHYLSTQLYQAGYCKSFYISLNYARKILVLLKKYNPAMIIQQGMQSRIVRYVIGKNIFEFKNEMVLNISN